MPDSGNIVGLDADNDKISRIGDCIKSIPGFVAGEWEGDRWLFDVGTGDVAFRGYLSRAGGVILAIGGTADPDRTEKMIEFIRLRLGADADILTVDGSLVPELPMERVPINEKAGHQEDNLMKAMGALAIHGVVYRRGNAITIPDTSITVKTRHGQRTQIGLATVTRAMLTARLERCCFFHTIQNNMKRPTSVPAYPSTRIVNQILEYTGEGASGIQPVTGVMAAPFLRLDGTVCDRPGYDEATGVFYDPCGTVFPPMPEITPENAKRIATEALNRLARPFREFRFDTSEKIAGEWSLTQDRDRVAAISMFMAILAVHAVRTSPGYLIEAPTFGSGKTLAAELPPMMLIGDDPALVNGTDMSTDTFSNDFDTALLAGRGYVVIDNVKGKVSGGKLLAMLTSKKISVRLYHTQRHVEVGDGMLLIITANNAEIDAEMARRLVRSRIDTGSERPNRIAHSFDPRDEVIRDRGQIVTDVLTVMRAYVVAGRPKQAGVSMGSFEDWASAVRDPLMWLGLARAHPGGAIVAARSAAPQSGPGQPGCGDLQQAAPARRDRHAGAGGGGGGLVPRDRRRVARFVRSGRPGADDPRDLPAGAEEVEQDELRRGADGDDAADERAAAGRVPPGRRRRQRDRARLFAGRPST